MFRLLLNSSDGFLGYESGVSQHSSRQLRHPMNQIHDRIWILIRHAPQGNQKRSETPMRRFVFPYRPNNDNIGLNGVSSVGKHLIVAFNS